MLITDHCPLNALSYTPGRVFAILAGVKQTDLVAVRVFEVGLSPKPGAVGRVFIERKSLGLELGYGVVEIIAFEIQNDVIREVSSFIVLDGQSRVTVGTFEACVTRKGIHDKPKAELIKELGRLLRFIGVDRYLV